jgi:hypothetical protein
MERCEHVIWAHLWARHGYAWVMGAVLREDDVVRRDGELGDEMF